MANTSDTNEYKVNQDADIEEDLKKFGDLYIASTIFEASEFEKIMEGNDGSNSSNGGDSTSGKKSIIKFGDGKADKFSTMQQKTMDIPSGELTDKKKEAIKKKAEKAKADKEEERDK